MVFGDAPFPQKGSGSNKKSDAKNLKNAIYSFILVAQHQRVVSKAAAKFTRGVLGQGPYRDSSMFTW